MTTLRIGGLGSGMDTEEIIRVMLQAEEYPIKTWEKRVFDGEDKINAYSALEQKLLDVRSATQKLNSFLTWNQKSATSTDSSVFTATAGASSQNGTYNVKVSQMAQAHRVAGAVQTSATAELNLSGEFSLGTGDNAVTVTVEGADSLNAIRDKINTAADDMDADEKIRASIVNNSLVLERTKTGATEIAAAETGAANNVLRSLGVLEGDPAGDLTYSTFANETRAAQDLNAEVNGVAVVRTVNSGITDVVQGITLNFHKKSDPAGDGETMTVGTDTANIKSIIEDFVEKYNDAMELAKAQSLVRLEGTGDAAEITGVGVLQGDFLLTDIQTKLRSMLATQINDPNVADPELNSMFKLGVWFDGQNNKLVIDEDKLNNALENHPASVEKLFSARAGSSGEEGIFRRMDDYLYKNLLDPIDGWLSSRQENIQKQISDDQKRIRERNEYLIQYEQTLWEKFARMEQAVSNIGSQWSYVQNTLGISR